VARLCEFVKETIWNRKCKESAVEFSNVPELWKFKLLVLNSSFFLYVCVVEPSRKIKVAQFACYG
jgi:hypothetical protein